jgi:DNA-binding NarL/FixJ family response regulator
MSSSSAEPAITLLLVDDHAIIRSGLRMLLEDQPNLQLVGEAKNGQEALALTEQFSPCVILLDLDLGDDTDNNLIPQLLARSPQSQILVLTGARDRELHRSAIGQGAMGIVLKENAPETIFKAIEKVHGGEVWLDRSMMASVLTEMTRNKDKVNVEEEKIAKLTDREREVITMLCEGLRNKQLADRLFIGEGTVRHHLTSVFEKLGISDRLELVIYAYRHGLAKLPE